MKNKSLYIGTYAGIPVKIHWTFLFVLLYIGYLGYSNDMSQNEYLWLGGFYFSVFFCVVLHEYGHSLTARKYGIGTQDILLSPIGGIARLDNIPEKPIQEFIVAIAGPLVNVVIALITGGLLFGQMGGLINMQEEDFKFLASPHGLLSGIFIANVALCVFNLIPAFPMDGGRILRAIMAHFFGRIKGTRIAMWIGTIFSIGFVFLGLYVSQYTLIFIGVFISYMARMELRNIISTEASKKINLRTVIRHDFTHIYSHFPMEEVINISFKTGEKSFLVYDIADNLIGTLPQVFIADYCKNGNSTELVRDYMSTKIRTLSINNSIQPISNTLQKEGLDIVPITEYGAIVGVIDRASITYAMNLYS